MDEMNHASEPVADEMVVHQLPPLQPGPPQSLAIDETYSDRRQIGQAETALARLIDLVSGQCQRALR